MMDLAEKSFGPNPNCQTILPPGVASTTRLLNWSAMRMSPGWLKWLAVKLKLPAETKVVEARTPATAYREQRSPIETNIFLQLLVITILLSCSKHVCCFAVTKRSEPLKSSLKKDSPKPPAPG